VLRGSKAPLQPTDRLQRATSENTTATDTPSKPAGNSNKPGRLQKKAGAEANGDGTRPWEGLFEASLKTADMGPPVIEFHDLRDSVVGGGKTWMEPVKCVLCGNQVN
jgi:hypothetical protein